MSTETDLLISVPRSCLNEFNSKYINLVETFYCVTLSENKSKHGKDNSDFVYYNVIFNLIPSDTNFDPKETLGRIQKYVESSLGWCGERGEDSSYDSEYEDDGAHKTASRTPSDTLAAEFAEYVTLHTPHQPQPNPAKIEFAVKLGYSEQLARQALQHLGADPPANELLAELIKLGGLTAQLPRAGSPPAPRSPPPVATAPPLRHIVIDGSNVAMSHGDKDVFSSRGIQICVDWFRARGHKEITVFVPKWRKESVRPGNPVADREVLDRLERERVLVYTPSRLVSGKRLICYDDRYVLKLAVDTDGIVVSNDNYRDLVAESADFRRVVEERLLMYTFVNDRFMPPDDPLGRSGPTLDAFLRAPHAPARPPPPPCPYGRKCTYGNKCKFHHPERVGRGHRSVAERLSERAARALRARDLHTVSLPMESAVDKRPVVRAHSAAPRLADPALAAHFDLAQCAGPSFTAPPPPPLANPHRKLARQLTLNPAYDPRLGGHPPVSRGASAPAGAADHAALDAPPLQHWEVRRRMHYHLSGIFPEAQVSAAMAAYPEETDAQTMCAIILARYRPNEAPPLPYPSY